MKAHRIVSVLLSVLLLCAMAVPALAADIGVTRYQGRPVVRRTDR